MKLTYERNGQIVLAMALADAHAAVGLAGAVALLYEPDRCLVGRLDDAAEVRDAEGRAIPLASVFEARIFTPQRELRWTMTPEAGRAVLLSEEAAPALGWKLAEVEIHERWEQTYLLAGQVEETAQAGWARLTSARTQALLVPVQGARNRVRLRALEYVRREPNNGNCYVFEERLVELEPVPEPRTGGAPN